MVKIGTLFRILIALAFAIVLVGGQAEAQETASTENAPGEIIGEYAPGEVLVKFKPGVARAQVEEIKNNLRVSTIRTIPRIGVQAMKIPEGRGVAEMVEALRGSPLVDYAEPNYRAYKAATPDDTYFSSQWALSQSSDHDIDAPEGWDITTGSSSIIIAVIDDGIDYNHEEFPSGKLWINPATSKPGYDFGMSDDDVMHESLSGSGHGTATAGIAAAATNNGKGIAGVSWESVIMPLKVEDSSGLILYSYLVNAIVFAVDHGARVISMSLGGPSSSAALENACYYAWVNGVVVVVSSGNDNTEISYPARYLTTIAVGATNEIDNRIYPGNPGNEWPGSQGSNYGPELDVVAPGINIYATDWSGSQGYSSGNYTPTFGGTSASCPFVAGEAALLLALDPSLPNERVRSIIRSSAQDQVGTTQDTPGFDNYYGYGRINLYNALSSPTRPDLTLSSSDITFSNDNPSPGEEITISATIHNNDSVYDEINKTPFAVVLQNTGSGFYVDAHYRVAQSFTATTDGYLGVVDLAMLDYSLDSAYAQIQIQTDNGSKPGGTIISSTERQDWSSTPIGWERIKFSHPAKITAGQKYWIVATCPDSSATGYLWGLNNGSVYAGGGQSGRDNSVSTPAWTTESATVDCQFKAYIYAYDTVIKFYDGNPGAGGTQIGPDRHPPPVPASGAITALMQWIASPGSHDIYVVVDPGNSIPEYDESNNSDFKSLTVGGGEMISFTIADYGNDGVKFGTLDPGMENQPADQTDIQGAVTLTVGSETNVDVAIQVRGADFTSPGVTIPIGNVKYDDVNNPASAVMLMENYVVWYTVPAATDDVREVWYWINIPSEQPAGSYTSTFYYKAEKSTP